MKSTKTIGFRYFFPCVFPHDTGIIWLSQSVCSTGIQILSKSVYCLMVYFFSFCLATLGHMWRRSPPSLKPILSAFQTFFPSCFFGTRHTPNPPLHCLVLMRCKSRKSHYERGCNGRWLLLQWGSCKCSIWFLTSYEHWWDRRNASEIKDKAADRRRSTDVLCWWRYSLLQ